jgi:hypothetical protein
MIEFLLSMMTVLFVLFWMWEGVMVVYTYNVLSDAAKEGLRYAIVHGPGNSNCSGPAPSGSGACPDASATNVVNIVKDYASYSFHDLSAVTAGCTALAANQICVSYPDGTNAPPNRVRVVVNYNFVPYIRLPWAAPHIVAVAEGRMVN